LWYYFFLPETKGRSLEEIDELFENNVPASGFKTYQTTILDQAVQEVRDHGNGSEKVAPVEVKAESEEK
jgi:hypothetical protein